MTFRVRTTVLAVSSLVLLAGCAVPGQEGAPGVAVQAAGETLTSSELDAIVEAWETDSEGAIVPDRQAIATSTVLGPELMRVAADQGIAITDGIGESWATVWLQYAGVENPEPSETMIESVKNVLAMYVTTATDPNGSLIEEAFTALPEDAAFSPRLGELSLDATVASAQAAFGDAQATGLGDYSFTAYLSVNGFVEPDHSWAARG